VRAKAQQTAAKTRGRGLPRVARKVAHKASSSDSLLVAGGLALVVLVLGDTIFLALSSRYLRA